MKRLLVSLLCVAMIATFMPGLAWADEETSGIEPESPVYVASIDEQKYETLDSALSAVQAGGTIKLLTDCIVSQTITIGTDKDFTLDLNGQTLKIDISEKSKSITAIVNNGKLTVTGNGTIERTGTGYGIDNKAGATLIIENGTFPNNSEDVVESALIRNLGTLTINGGTFEDDHIVIKNDDSSAAVYGTLTINGGSFKGNNIRKAEDGRGYSTIQNSGQMIINDGTFEGGNNTILSLLYDAPTQTEINGGTFSNNDGNVYYSYKDTAGSASDDSAKNNITGGSFSGVVKVEKTADFISGGTFSSDVSNYVDDESTAVALTSDDETTYYVGTADAVAAKIKTEAVSGDTVTVTQGGGTFDIAAGVTINNATSKDITVKTPNGTITVGAGEEETAKPYTPPYIPPTTPTVQKPTVETDANATVTLSDYGTIATITVAEGYELVDVTVNGVSKGKVTTVAGLKTGDKLVVTTQKKADTEEPGETDAEKNARLKAGVENTTIKLTSTLGKGFIKLNWTKSAGYKVDYYEVYKSKKRYSGYGTESYFDTKQGGMTGWYKNTKELKKGTRYYYKVRGVREIAGETVYTQYSNKAWRLVK